MRIFNIHGYHGTAQNAAAGAMGELGHDIITPSIDYDAFKPEYIAGELGYMVKEAQPDIMVGTSLGGFFALYLAIENDLPAILVNPALMPFMSLPRIGYEGDIRGFIGMFGCFTRLKMNRTYAVIGGSDEVIDTHDFTKRMIPNNIVVPEGKHSGATLGLPVHFAKILEEIK